MSGLDDYERAAWCGPDVPAGEVADRCADWKVRATPAYRTTDMSCEGGRTVDGVMVLCSHDCHGLPDKPRPTARDGF